MAAYQTSAIEAGTSASNGPIQNPWMTLAATREEKLFAAAAQKQVTIRPIVVNRYTGLFPYLTATEFQIRLPKAIATMRPPWTPWMNVDRDTLNSAESSTNAGPRRGPIAVPN
jgi:hypothetical protein